MKIGDLAKLSGLSVHTIRYYEKVGLLPSAHRDAGGRRQYGHDIVRWLDFLAALKRTGMGIADMVRYAQLRSKGPETGQQRKTMLQVQRQKVLDKISDLEATLPVLDHKIMLYDDMERQHLMEQNDHDNSEHTDLSATEQKYLERRRS
ncbi:MerR family transcriptional regulator [Cohaesibacter gelatinilyticus]|uniref:Transcriptional regulator, MerR family n=1 Tax=Cohaesibacter gelatinilyticus TaxID=372072 RepID=A0A285PNW2_9HYPH|nr:MerR family transcriptional regulator [Cohaesibacter gelatinilyticus]SNZ21601.1 transcriptional regulator, MerR family [Cohaesibacter gelatinilyticus]HAT85156.1 MerR family transcriptional regulator [Hyphomicrobiales bacterium]